MQTFITDHNMDNSAANLDYKRLGGQRGEAIKIAKINLGLSEGWKHHPTIKMWGKYVPYLITNYLSSIIKEWEGRKYKNEKSRRQYEELLKFLEKIGQTNPIKPHWITNEFILAHRSNLIRKKPEFYQPLWPDIPNDLPYIWPI